MDDAAMLIAALLGIVGVLTFFLGVVMFVWGAVTLGVRFGSDPTESEDSFWGAVKEILKKCLSIAFDQKRPLADRRMALGFILMILGAGILITALGIVVGAAVADGSDGSGTTDTTTTDTLITPTG